MNIIDVIKRLKTSNPDLDAESLSLAANIRLQRYNSLRRTQMLYNNYLALERKIRRTGWQNRELRILRERFNIN